MSEEPTSLEVYNNKWHSETLAPAIERLANLPNEDWDALMTVYNYFGSKMGEGVIKGARVVAERHRADQMKGEGHE